MLVPSANDHSYEELLAVIQAVFRENSRAISILTRLLKTPGDSFIYDTTLVTPALLRLDPFWDPLRGDPAFQRLCEENAAVMLRPAHHIEALLIHRGFLPRLAAVKLGVADVFVYVSSL